MSKRDGMSDIFMQSLSELFLFFCGGMRNDYKFPLFNLSLLCHFLEEGRQCSLPNPQRVKTQDTGAEGLVYLSSSRTN